MEDNIEDYSERIDNLKSIISRAEATLELRKSELKNLKDEYKNLESSCKEKFNISLKDLKSKIAENTKLVEKKLLEAEQKYDALKEEKDDSE
jgi:hypothetical protein